MYQKILRNIDFAIRELQIVIGKLRIEITNMLESSKSTFFDD